MEYKRSHWELSTGKSSGPELFLIITVIDYFGKVHVKLPWKTENPDIADVAILFLLIWIYLLL